MAGRLSTVQDHLLNQLICSIIDLKHDHRFVRRLHQIAEKELRVTNRLVGGIGCDSHRLTRRVEGLAEKWHVLTRDYEALTLCQLWKAVRSSKFEPPFTDQIWSADSEIHFGSIFLLLELQQAISTPYVAQWHPLSDETAEQETQRRKLEIEVFRREMWAEVSDLVRTDYGGSSEEDDTTVYEPDDEEELRFAEQSTQNANEKMTASELSTALEDLKAQQRGQHQLASDAMLLDNSEDWLLGHVQPEYWQRHASRSEQVAAGMLDLSSRLHRGSSFQNAIILNLETQNCRELTESTVLRECLWILGGIVTESFVFHVQHSDTILVRNTVRPSFRVYMRHLSAASFNCILERIALLATCTLRWQCIVNAGMIRTDVTEPMRGLIALLSGVLCDWRAELLMYEKKVQRFELHTLLELCNVLHPWLHRLFALDEPIRAILMGSFEPLASPAASVRLVNFFTKRAASSELVATDVRLRTYFQRALFNCSAPYVIQLEALLAGRLIDAQLDSAFLEYNHSADPHLETYWNEAFRLRNWSANDCVDDTAVPTHLKRTDNGSNGSGSLLGSIPHVFHPILSALISTVKSMDIIRLIAQEMSEPCIWRNVLHQAQTENFEGSNHMTLIGQLEKLLISNDDLCLNLSLSTNTYVTANKALSESTLLHAHEREPILCSIFSDLLDFNANCTSSTDIMILKKASSTSSSALSRAMSDLPLHLAVNRVLYCHVKQRHVEISSALRTLLMERFRLAETFSLMRATFMLEDYSGLQDFVENIFVGLTHGSTEWRDELTLNLFLQSCIQDCLVTQRLRLLLGAKSDNVKLEPSLRFSIRLVKSESMAFERNGLAQLETVYLDYTPSWPLHFIISRHCVEMYAKIFQFLLQIRCVKFALEQLRFKLFLKKCSSETTAEETRRLFILRSQLLHVVNSLHQLITQRVIQRYTHELDRTLNTRQADLLDLMSAHQECVTRIYRACFLEPTFASLRRALLNLLALGLSVQQLWQRGHLAGLATLEEQFSQYRCFLCSLLSGVLRKAGGIGSFSQRIDFASVDYESHVHHLEPLLVALEMCGKL